MQPKIKKFSELSTTQLYRILKLRFDVFIVEQNSIFNEMDDLDYNAVHFLYEESNEIVAYLRLFQKENKVVLSRIVVPKKFRKKGYGKQIILDAIEYAKSEYKCEGIFISGQKELKGYYESLGFEQVSDEYDDGGILHIDMILKL